MRLNNMKFTLLAVHAHPDDESIGTGGTLAKYSAEGVDTVVAFCTQGEAGAIQNPDFIPPSPGMDIAEIRAIELERALEVLGVGSAHFLGYRDSGMVGAKDNLDPRAFVQADMDEAAGRLVEIIRRTRPHVVVTYNEKGFYGHPDHVMAHRITRLAFVASGDPHQYSDQGLEPWEPRKLYYTAVPRSRLLMAQKLMQEKGEDIVISPDLGTPDDEITTSIDVREYLDLKMKALNCHQSQLSPNSFFRRLPEEWRVEAFGYEHYVCTNGCDDKRGGETDLFEGIS